MQVTLKSFANIRDVIGEPQVCLELPQGSTLSDLFDTLLRTYGQAFDRQVRDQQSKELVPFLILINDKTFRSIADQDTPLQHGDIITFMVPFDGG